MPSTEISEWIAQAKKGNREAAMHLLQHYFEDLVRQARKHLHQDARRAADEDDIALSAFDSVYRGIEGQRFPRLNDRGNLWGMLLFKTRTKALNWNKHEALRHPPLTEDDVSRLFCDGEVARDISPADAAVFADEVRRLLAGLPEEPDRPLRSVARRLLEGQAPAEVARALGCLAADVERWRDLVLARWKREV
jgi:DNA-directed RNA polymerase specialized sigma24 family protein